VTLSRAVLQLPPTDVDGDGTDESGEFHMAGDLEIAPAIRTGFLIGGRGSQVNNILARAAGAGESSQGGFFLDLGAGARTVSVKFSSWKGARDSDGNPLQWGNEGADDAPTKADATGADAITQIDVLMQYLAVGRVDSSSPATLHYGEHHTTSVHPDGEDGLYDPLNVVIETPDLTRPTGEGNSFSGEITFVEAAAIEEVHDAAGQLEIG
jgi:hypothetical protein